MAGQLYLPESYPDLIIKLHELEKDEGSAVHELLKNELHLLPSTGFCKHCGKEADLELPANNSKAHNIRSQCPDKQCRKKHSYKRSVHFSEHSVFGRFDQKPKADVVKGIYLFCMMIPPRSAARLISKSTSRNWVRRLYRRIREALQRHNNKYHGGRLGGRVLSTDDPRAGTAVFMDAVWRLVVEADESTYVCTCVCVCVRV